MLGKEAMTSSQEAVMAVREPPTRAQMTHLSYSAQFDILLPHPDPNPWDRKKAVPKPSLLAQVSGPLI